MEEKIVLIIVFVLISATILLLWNNITLNKILQLGKKNETHLPDDKYFELKYKIQYMSFAATLLIAIISILGYSTFNNIKNDLKNDLNNVTKEYNTKMKTTSAIYDSLINLRIDKINKALSDAYDELTKSSDDAYRELNAELTSARKEVTGYNEKMKILSEKIGYKRLYVINDFKIPSLPRIKMTFQNLGFTNLESVPSVFITPKEDFEVVINKVAKEYVEIGIKNAKTDSVSISLLIFN